MKKVFVLIIVAASVITAHSQSLSLNAPGNGSESFAARTPRPGVETPLLTLELRPNEVRFDRYVLSGILVEIANTKNPVQLLNPYAPPEYGSVEDNFLRDLLGREKPGLKIVSFSL